MKYLPLLICVCAALGAYSAKLPSSFPKCNWKKTDCLTKAVETGIRLMSKPNKELNLPHLGPVIIPALNVEAGFGAVGFQQNFLNMKVTGFDETICSKAEFNEGKRSLIIDCVVPHFRMDFDYEFTGKIMTMPMSGKGPGFGIMHDNHLIFTVTLEKYERNGKKHFKVASRQLHMLPKYIEVKLDNLFDGDKQLGDNLNKMMNENSIELYQDVQPSYEEVFGKIFASIFDNLLSKVAITDIMDN